METQIETEDVKPIDAARQTLAQAVGGDVSDWTGEQRPDGVFVFAETEDAPRRWLINGQCSASVPAGLDNVDEAATWLR